MNFPHLATRLFNVPLAVHPAKAEIVMAALADRLGITQLYRDGKPVPLAFDFDLDDDLSMPVHDRGYDAVAGVAIVPVQGTLVQRTGTLRPYSGMSGYDQIRSAFALALEDEEIRAIVLDIDSPGGEAAGLFDLVDGLYNARGQKPVWAILSEVAYSGGYAIASAADRIVVPRTGGTGSIGVLCLHVDFSKALAQGGLAVTFIQFGARKSDGAPHKPLSAGALSAIQADIDMVGELFVETVARNRGLATAAVRATEAATFQGSAGVEQRLADQVMAPDQAFRELLESLG